MTLQEQNKCWATCKILQQSSKAEPGATKSCQGAMELSIEGLAQMIDSRSQHNSSWKSPESFFMNTWAAQLGPFSLALLPGQCAELLTSLSWQRYSRRTWLYLSDVAVASCVHTWLRFWSHRLLNCTYKNGNNQCIKRTYSLYNMTIIWQVFIHSS